MLIGDMDPSDPRILFNTKFASIVDHQLHQQSLFVYHTMYRGICDRVRVVDSPNRSINGRYGLILGYNTDKSKFRVRLDTQLVMPATRFTGEDMLLCPSLLQIVPYHQEHVSRQKRLDSTGHGLACTSAKNWLSLPKLPLNCTAVFLSLDDKDGNYATSIAVSRPVIDTLYSTMNFGTADELSMSVVRPFIFATKCATSLHKLVVNANHIGVQCGSRRKKKNSVPYSPWHLDFDNSNNVIDTIQNRQRRQAMYMGEATKKRTVSALHTGKATDQEYCGSKHELLCMPCGTTINPCPPCQCYFIHMARSPPSK